MHIHGSIPNVQGGSFYGISNGERAAAARRAAETRKRLLRAGEEGAEDPVPEETALIGRWMDARYHQERNADEYSESGRDPDFE